MSEDKKTEDGYPEDAPQRGYAFEGTKIMRHDDGDVTHVANFSGGVLSIHPDHQKYRGAVNRWLSGEPNLKTVKSVILIGDEAAVHARSKQAIPPMPKMTRQAGDKTPELVEWYRDYKPEEYKAKYGIIGPGKVTKWRKALDDETGEPIDVPYEQDCILATRKTHLTELPQSGETDSDMYSD